MQQALDLCHFHLLKIGSGSRNLCGRFSMVSSTRARWSWLQAGVLNLENR
jgi:hypothetical protein